MDKKMITLPVELEFTGERLEEIFSVSKTKELFKKLLAQEDVREVYLKFTSDGITVEEIETAIKIYILTLSMKRVVAEGKSLDKAVQEEIWKQRNELAATFEKVTLVSVHD